MVSTGAKNPTDKSHNHETEEDEDDDGRVGGGGDGEMEEKPQGNNNNGEAFGLGPELLLFISLPLAQDNNVGRRRPEDGQMFCVGGGGNYD